MGSIWIFGVSIEILENSLKPNGLIVREYAQNLQVNILLI